MTLACHNQSPFSLQKAVYLGLAVILAGCANAEPTEQNDQAECSLPWKNIGQVHDCAAPTYTVVENVVGADAQTAHIVVRPKDPPTIAAALAHAWVTQIPEEEEAVVWAWSRAVLIGFGYDRGVLSEQGELGELLVFEVCTEWGGGGELGELCTDTLRFSIEQ